MFTSRKPDPIAPGQESVWDYPRPPAIRPNTAEIVVELGGVTICTTRSGWQVLETSHPPSYYLPRSDFLDGALVPTAGHSVCEWKGLASYLDVVGGDQVARRAAWHYPEPSPRFRDLVGHVALYPAAMDRCLVNGELVTPQAGGFYGG